MAAAYLIFVSFGAPPHLFSPVKGHQKCLKSQQKSPNWPKYAKISRSLRKKRHRFEKKKYTAAGCGVCDNYQQCMCEEVLSNILLSSGKTISEDIVQLNH